MADKKQEARERLQAELDKKIDQLDVTELEDTDLEDVAGGGNYNCGCGSSSER